MESFGGSNSLFTVGASGLTMTQPSSGAYVPIEWRYGNSTNRRAVMTLNGDVTFVGHADNTQSAVVDVNEPIGTYGDGYFTWTGARNFIIGNGGADVDLVFKPRFAGDGSLVKQGLGTLELQGIGDESWSVERRQAYEERVAELGYPCSAMMWSNAQERRVMLSTRLRSVANWIRTLQMPVGIFVSSDSRALIVRDAVVDAGYAIGRDVAILGVDNDRAFCEMPSPSLSSIDADHHEVGYRAAGWLDRLMRGEHPPREPVLVPPRGIVVRESTDFLAVADPIVQRAMAFIRLRAHEGIQVSDIVAASYASRSVLQRRFRDLLGQGVHDVLLQEKLRRAIRLLRETNEPIESIAEMSGFTYVQSLNKALHRLYHTSARAYRRRDGLLSREIPQKGETNEA